MADLTISKCIGTTKVGIRCERKSLPALEYCGQHCPDNKRCSAMTREDKRCTRNVWNENTLCTIHKRISEAPPKAIKSRVRKPRVKKNSAEKSSKMPNPSGSDGKIIKTKVRKAHFEKNTPSELSIGHDDAKPTSKKSKVPQVKKKIQKLSTGNENVRHHKSAAIKSTTTIFLQSDDDDDDMMMSESKIFKISGDLCDLKMVLNDRLISMKPLTVEEREHCANIVLHLDNDEYTHQEIIETLMIFIQLLVKS